MNTPQNIIFVCPCCKAQLSVPSTMAGITGPCPQCRTQITAPIPQLATPQQPVQPSAYDAAQPLASHAVKPATAPPEPIRPEPRPAAIGRSPSHAPPQDYPSSHTPDEAKSPSTTIPVSLPRPRKTNQKYTSLLRVLIPLTILAVLGIGIFALYQFLASNNYNKRTDQSAKKTISSTTSPLPKEVTSTAKENVILKEPSPSIEATLEPSELPVISKDTTAIKVTAPENPVIPITDPPPITSPAINQNEDSGAAVAKLVEAFVAATTLEQRMPMVYTTKTPQELQNTIMNRPWPSAKISPGSQIPHTAERLVEYYYEARFNISSLGFPSQATILVHKRGDEPAKILLEPLLDTLGGRLADFAKSPSDVPQDFYVIMDARVKCFDNAVPGAHKKSTFFLRAHSTGEDIATAYANEQSDTRKAFDNPLEGLKWKNPMPAIVTLQWNTTEDIKRPFLELLVIKSKNWIP